MDELAMELSVVNRISEHRAREIIEVILARTEAGRAAKRRLPRLGRRRVVGPAVPIVRPCTCSYDDSDEMTRHARLCAYWTTGYHNG